MTLFFGVPPLNKLKTIVTTPKLRYDYNAKDQDELIKRIQTANLPDGDKKILTGLIEFNNWLQFIVQ